MKAKYEKYGKVQTLEELEGTMFYEVEPNYLISLTEPKGTYVLCDDNGFYAVKEADLGYRSPCDNFMVSENHDTIEEIMEAINKNDESIWKEI